MSSEIQYAKVSACVWRDRGFRGLSFDGKLVWLYVLTCPGMRSFGAMFATVPGMAAELGMDLGRFEGAWGEVLGSGMVRFDGEAGLVVVPNFLRYNPPASPNVVRSWRKAWVLLPECGLLGVYFQEVKAFAEGFGEGFGKAFREAFGEGIGNPLANLLTPNSELYIKNPPISPQGGEHVEEGGEGEGGEDSRRAGRTAAGSMAQREGGEGTEGTEETEETEGSDSTTGDTGGTGRVEGGLRQDAAATGNVQRATSNVERRRRRGADGVDVLAGHPVLQEALGVFRERLVGVHGRLASLGRLEEEGRVLLRLVGLGFEERDVVAILKWVLWEEPEPLRPGGFCWRDQFRSIGGLVKPMRSGEMKFKGMAAGYEAWARAQLGVVVPRHGGEGKSLPRRQGGTEGEELVRRWVAAGVNT